ncbi:MAG: hypothetical protein ACJ8C4_02340 [Gemmataceae bacterium]
MTRGTFVVVVLATAIAWLGATDRPGGWNDGSRLATVESLVDRHTWEIDDSIFCTATPYGGDLAPRGTLDKLFINGHYYSDKSPVPALLMAGPYWLWRICGGPSAAERPDLFCWGMTFLTSGMAYVISVLLIDRIGERSLVGWQRMLVTASFALATIALPYSRSVNNHILLLAVATAILFICDSARPLSAVRVLILGTLAGLAYTIDLGAGPVIALGTGVYLVWRTFLEPATWCSAAPTSHSISQPSSPLPSSSGPLPPCGGGIGWGVEAREDSTPHPNPPPQGGRGPEGGRMGQRVSHIFLFIFAALPWLAMHHGMTYAMAGTIGPANANPEFFKWPGCPFGPENLTGGWRHSSIFGFIVYAVDMLLGQRGFAAHNPALFLVVPAAITLLRDGQARRAETSMCLGWTLAVWLLYAATSNNMSGECRSVRWFVPLLAPAYVILIRALRENSNAVRAFCWLSAIGAFMEIQAWIRGPWYGRLLPGYWLCLVASAGIFFWFLRRQTINESVERVQRAAA